MKTKKNYLDEMQEQKALHIEQRSYQIMFAGLSAAVVIQSAMGASLREMLPETIILLAVSIYSLIAFIKNGIWDRRFKPNNKTNAVLSVVTGLVMGGVWGVVNYIRYDSLYNALLTFVMMFLSISLVCYATFWLACTAYKRRSKQLDDRLESSEDSSDDNKLR